MINTAIFQINSYKWLRDAAAVIGASLVLSLVAPLAIPLPFSPVPLSLATLFVLFFAVTLGSKRASLAVLGYLAQGLMGLPVFSKGGSGLLHFAGPTGGYLVGYLAAAFVTGYLVERLQNRSGAKLFGSIFLGSLPIYFFGVLHLSLFLGAGQAILLGFVPFIAGDLLKALVITRVCAAFQRR